MKLKGREKYFWEQNFGIKNMESIPKSIDRIKGVDTEHDDEYFYFLAARVASIREIWLRCTQVTDIGIQYISRLNGLKSLTLRDHSHITTSSLPYLNKLTELEYLDLSKNSIRIEDLYELTNLKNLKQLHISSDLHEEEIREELDKVKKHFPGCEIIIS